MLHTTEAALHERVKELTCLYGISQLAQKPGLTLDKILQGVVELLPPAWQYPEITSAKIIIDGKVYAKQNLKEPGAKQIADIVIDNTNRGRVEVVYANEKPELDEGPFLKEERNLINAVAGHVAFIIERKEAEIEKSKLENQLRHADRLATIGLLAAGVAHELNEPLANILGFAQLSKKCSELPRQVRKDLEKIESASLYSREIIKKLLVFARQIPPEKIQVNLNKIIDEGLYFFKARCAKEGIELVSSLSSDLPEIIADSAQLNQVLVNLVVNAIQAMPKGGKLLVQTSSQQDNVLLIVEDTGIGIEEHVIEKIFIPFFTTKEIGQGTGLGLPVVHGIVTSHGGSINVKSKVGHGTRFEIILPLRGKKKGEAPK